MLGAVFELAAGGRAPEAMVVEAVILRLQSLHVWQGGHLEAIEPWNGQSPDELATLLQGRVPAALVSVGDAALTRPRGRRNHGRMDCDLEVYVISGHLYSRAHRNVGDEASAVDGAQDPGAYLIKHQVRQLLYGHDTCVAGAGTLAPRQETLVQQEPEFTVWRMLFSFALDAAAAVAAVQPLEAIRVRHTLASAIDDSPADSLADVTTELELVP